jgi:hypothetical protein
MKVTAEITANQKQFLERIIFEDAASSLGGKGELGNSVQWCIDACIRIERLYGIDACHIAHNDIRVPENAEGLLPIGSKPQKYAPEI